jgi:multidrug efflux pump subunit AcrA (membrane-fusion protein)
MRINRLHFVSTSPWIRWTLAVVCLILGWAAWDCRTRTDIEVSTSAVTSGPITRRIMAVGTVQAVTTVEVGAEVSGVIQSLEADFNSPVHAGQVIARIDPAAYDARAGEARAALAQAQATSARARADLGRFEALGEREMPTPGEATVWEFDGTQLTPIAVRAGLAGDGWTELLSGPLRSGDALVTSAVVQGRSGL